MDYTGTLKVKGETQQVTESFKKREFVITDEQSQYPQHIQFELTQDKCSLLDKYYAGDEIKVHFNLRGREWVDKEGRTRYFNSLQAWRIELIHKGDGEQQQQNNASDNYGSSASEGAGDDMPF